MATKTARRPLSAKEHDAEFRAGMKRIDAILKRMEKRDKEMAPVWRELKKIADE
jgi:hypothetical protein